MCIPSTPDIPPPPPPPAIPQAPQRQDASVLSARKAARSKAKQQSGYSSTLITGGRGVNEAGYATTKPDMGTGNIVTSSPDSVALKRQNNKTLISGYQSGFK